jgi:microtubule-associated protein, RP/EB family
MEFSQMLKKIWDQHYMASPDGYDALGRRHEQPPQQPLGEQGDRGQERVVPSPAIKTAMKRANVPAKSSSRMDSAPSSLTAGEDAALLLKLKRAVAELKDASVKMQEERDFYFGKLRELEVLVTTPQDVAHLDKDGLLAKIQEILYAPLSS